MNKPASFILILLSLSLITPLLIDAQVAEIKAAKSYVELGLIGFQKGKEAIPLNGTSIPLLADETVWLLALSDISIDYGPVDQEPLHIGRIPVGVEVPLRPIAPIPCCGVLLTYRLTITAYSEQQAGSKVFERATLIYVSGGERRTLTASILPANASLQVMLEDLPLSPSTRLALLKLGGNESIASGLYGTIRYRSVAKPQSTLQIIYDPSTGVVPNGSVVHFLLLSPRAFLSEGEGLKAIKLHRDGIVASAVVDLNRTAGRPVTVNIMTSVLGEPGEGGDTPLQPGLHFLYIYIEGQELVRRDEKGRVVGAGGGLPYGSYGADYDVDIEALTEQTFIPIFIFDDDNYTLLDHTIASEAPLSLDFSKEVPSNVLVVATLSTQGVTSSIYNAILTVPVARIALYDGKQPIDEYTLTLEPSRPSTKIGGVTYVIGEALGKTALLTRVKVNNFTLASYKIEGRGTNVIGFPDELNLTTTLNKVAISANDEFGKPVPDSSVRVEKEGEVYTFPADRPRTLRLPNGNYKVVLMIGGLPISEKTVEVPSPSPIVLTVSTVQAADVALLAVILIETVILVLLTVKILKSSRRRVESWSGRP